jgi:hypothetical protein
MTNERAPSAETDLYAPVKAWLEQQGYVVRSEVRGCDVVGIKLDEEWPVIVELKRRFNLSLFLQTMDRLRITPHVYVAAERVEGRGAFSIAQIRRLCLQLGIGLLTIKLYRRKPAFVEVHCHPGDVSERPSSPTKVGRRTNRLTSEFNQRSGDFNVGGSGGRKLVTAYREKALQCALALQQHGPQSPRQVRMKIGTEKAATILRDNVYGWFHRVQRGLYELTPVGTAALEEYNFVLRMQRSD